jgi:periplasmic protein TonB
MNSAMLLVALISSFGAAPLQIANEQVYEAGNGISLPVAIKQVHPQYTPGAMKERVQGTVWLKGVVRPGGQVTDIEVVRSLHAELDGQAIAAFVQWQFKPGTLDGKPVAVRITVEMTFTLK